MAQGSPAAETFLAKFHDARPGLTPKAYGALAVTHRGRVHGSTYELLCGVVPAAARVLDLACGDGYLLSLLAARGQPAAALCGVDLSAGELAAAARRLGPGVTLIESRAQNLPCADAQFDCVLCHMALMLMHDVEEVLREVRRVLRPGGTFAAIVGAKAPPTPAFSAYVQALQRHARDPRWAEVRWGDPRLRSKEGIVELVSPFFATVVVDDVEAPMRLAPAAWWAWVEDMYDLYLLPEDARQAVRHEAMEAVRAACGSDGKLEFPQAMRCIRALA